MTNGRIALLPLSALALAATFPASAQTVVSAHSGVLYFFEGSVFMGEERLEQKFGKFPDIGEGREVRTERGRAEVLLTPGVFLRVNENSAIRMLSNKLSDTRVELLGGSAILESVEAGKDTSVKLLYKNWQVQVPQECVYRIDSEPPQLQVYKGEVKVSTEGKAETVAVKEGKVLPLAAVLVPDESPIASGDAFKSWAISRSQAISADNAIAAEIVDDPNQFDSLSPGLGGLSYFPPTGIPSLGITRPYGLGFWSPYQSGLSSIYFPSYYYGTLYPGWPSGVHSYPRPIGIPSWTGTGTRPGGITPIRIPAPSIPPPRTAPHAPAPHVGVHTVGHR